MQELEQRQESVTDSTYDKEQFLDQIMNDYSDGILHLVYTYVKNRTQAEDLTQEIFIKCYEKADQFHHLSSVKTWVYRVASNHCKDYLRSWHYRKITLSEKLADYLPSKTRQVEEDFMRKNEEQTLADAVFSLPIKYREVVFLHYYQELNLTEISKVTSVNVNTLKTRLKRAKELLKDLIEEVE